LGFVDALLVFLSHFINYGPIVSPFFCFCKV
jgi:hypothetical protein